MNYQDMITELEARAAQCLDCAAKIRHCFGPLQACSEAPAATEVQTVAKAKPAKVTGLKPAAKVSGKPSRVTADRVLAAIVDGKGLTAAEVGVKLGCSVENAWYHLNRLKKDAKLTVGADKKYRRAITAN